MTPHRRKALLAFVVAAAAPVVVCADPAPMAGSAPAVSKTGLDARLDPNAIVCKSEDQTGSRLGAKKVCLTRQQWADMAKSSRERLEENQRSSRSN